MVEHGAHKGARLCKVSLQASVAVGVVDAYDCARSFRFTISKTDRRKLQSRQKRARLDDARSRRAISILIDRAFVTHLLDV